MSGIRVTMMAAVAVEKREWLVVADWLEQHDVASHPDTEDAERETWFEWWIDRQCNLCRQSSPETSQAQRHRKRTS